MLKVICILLSSIIIFVNSVAIPKIYSSKATDNDLDYTDNEIVRPNVCTSEVCVREAIRIVSSLNVSADPCDNFYEFVCGKYIHDTVLPEDKYKESAFSIVQDQIDKKMMAALFEEPKPNEPRAFELAKTFTQICMDETTQNQKGVQPLMDILDRYGGWPVVEGDEWKAANWSWIEMLKNMSNDGLPADYILKTVVGPDYEDTTKNNIKIGRADPGLDKELLLKGVNDTNVKAYLEFMVDVAVMLGANKTRAQNEMTEVLLFEESLANVHPDQYYAKHPIHELEEIYTQINWTDFVNWNLNNVHRVTENETVVFYDPFYVDYLVTELETLSKRTIANYLAWRLVLMSSEFLNDELRQRFYQFEASKSGVQKIHPRSSKCAKQTMEFLPIATGAMYVRQFFDEKSRNVATNVAKAIHEEFIETLKEVPWLDDESRTVAIEKANAMEFFIGYPDALMNDTILDQFYNELELQPSDSFLQSQFRVRKFLQDVNIRMLYKPVKKNDWSEQSSRLTNVDAFYSVLENSIQIPASILQNRFFSADRPQYMNFGSIGFFLGHEITHGFDDTGRRFDANSNMVDWWQMDTVDKFESKAKCFVDQYSNYSNPALNITVNGENTQGENIADVGGFKAAYGAYQRYVQQNGADPALPGLNYTANQLFWIAAAHIWCTVTRPEYEITQAATNVHTPFNYRIIGAFSNSERFSNDFNCAAGSGMNPTKKCEIW